MVDVVVVAILLFVVVLSLWPRVKTVVYFEAAAVTVELLGFDRWYGRRAHVVLQTLTTDRNAQFCGETNCVLRRL